MKQFLVDLPNIDSSQPWIIIQMFDTKEEALAFTKKIWNTNDEGLLCLISEDGEYYIVDVPNPNYKSNNNQFLEVEKFHHKSDALDFAMSNYHTDRHGCVSLISKV